MNSQLYRTIREVDAGDVPRSARGIPRSGKRRIIGWKELAIELTLRLERTHSSKWLRVEFHDEDELRRGYFSLYAWFNRFGVSVTTRRDTRNGSAVLYIQRGPDWGGRQARS
jgi:hypothetical protein